MGRAEQPLFHDPLPSSFRDQHYHHRHQTIFHRELHAILKSSRDASCPPHGLLPHFCLLTPYWRFTSPPCVISSVKTPGPGSRGSDGDVGGQLLEGLDLKDSDPVRVNEEINRRQTPPLSCTVDIQSSSSRPSRDIQIRLPGLVIKEFCLQTAAPCKDTCHPKTFRLDFQVSSQKSSISRSAPPCEDTCHPETFGLDFQLSSQKKSISRRTPPM
ncbi:hypothetical protein NE237_017720 [Protea cynaroides]|uniref:Uncharacterized protein n=1 Tax=Protea cynaroides TaxID=273540 RepID=A0A9Q0K8L9_9MAGN|nr:hypothetical protein NE237_017720 [Protea cynaroides]